METRKKKFADEKFTKKFAELVRQGVSIKNCCSAMCINESTYYRAIDKGEKDYNAEVESVESKLYKAIKKAQAEFESDNLALIKSFAPKDWKAAAWLLERRLPQTYALHQNVNVGEDNKINVIMDVPTTRKKVKKQ